jgi:hypothetical protein
MPWPFASRYLSAMIVMMVMVFFFVVARRVVVSHRQRRNSRHHHRHQTSHQKDQYSAAQVTTSLSVGSQNLPCVWKDPDFRLQVCLYGGFRQVVYQTLFLLTLQY